MVVLSALHFRVEDDDVFERMAEGEHGEHRVVLLLLADEDEPHLRIVDHIPHLCGTRGGIEGDADGADAESSEFTVEIFGHVLREDGYILLHLDAQGEHAKTGSFDAGVEDTPINFLPLAFIVVFILQNGAFSVDFCTLMDEQGKVWIDFHS